MRDSLGIFVLVLRLSSSGSEIIQTFYSEYEFEVVNALKHML